MFLQKGPKPIPQKDPSAEVAHEGHEDLIDPEPKTTYRPGSGKAKYSGQAGYAWMSYSSGWI